MRKLENECSCSGGCGENARSGLNRRDFMQTAAVAAGGAGWLAAGSKAAYAAGPDLPKEEEAQLIAMGREASQDGQGNPSKYPRPMARAYNGPYAGANLNRVAFPIGGLGAGMFCLEGTGAISHVSVRNTMEFYHEPCTFAAVCVKGQPNMARVLEGPVPDWKFFGMPNTGNGEPGATYGLPRFREAAFAARFPFATVELRDEALPLRATITGWSPFLPADPDNSSLPVGALEYTFHNDSANPIEAVFSFNTKNFMAKPGGGDRVKAFPKGFLLHQEPGDAPERGGAFAAYVDAEQVAVDHCWFRGGWWDALTLAWRNVQEGTLLDNPPMDVPAPGASLSVPFSLAPGASRTVRLMTAWYAPHTKLRVGSENRPAFTEATATGAANGQQEVTGFLGERLVNSFYPDGDVPKGVLISKPFKLTQKYIHFLLGGASDPQKARMELVVDGKAVRVAAGLDTEALSWKSWDVNEFKGREAVIRIVDASSEGWGHILVDHIIVSKKPIKDLKQADGNELKKHARAILFEDFESVTLKDWSRETEGEKACCSKESACCSSPEYHVPWYAGRFDGIEAVAAYWTEHYDFLRQESARFRDAFYDTTLPMEVVEAVAANLTILKSPTVLRQTDGRLWCWEGCCDGSGCCHGSCTHVWNYAQAISHLFPSLERTLRQTEFHESQFEDGCQTFRANLPIRPGGNAMAASDGQLGGIMKVYREWRVSGDTEWLRAYWPLVKQSLDYIIGHCDPRETGLLEESHHNTYDINYFGPDGHCGSFYLGALAAACKMGEALAEDTPRYRGLLEKGAKRLEDELFNGEYFYQKIMTEGLDNPSPPLNPDDQSEGYRAIAELVNQQGPKYQYGTGCLSDGVLGFWMARMCGLDDALVDAAKVRSHLKSVHRHNLKTDLSAHANPQRPTFAMGNDGGLLLCTWPKGGALTIPFVYSDEVWTGIEYQVASHCMLEGMVDEGLEIVRACRDRYDGVRRNPFNEYECGHWYARAMSSYGLLQGLTGLRYDAVEKTLYIDSKIGDFRAFLATATGYAQVELKSGKPKVDVKAGTIEIAKYVVAGKEVAG